MPRLSGNWLRILGIISAMVVAGCSSPSRDTTETPPRTAKERQQLEARAQSGERNAQFLLGYELCCGTSRRDIPRATTWLCRAAAQGEPRARFHLGQIYSRGLDDVSVTAKVMRSLGTSGGGKNARPRLAAVWFDLAMASGHPDAARHRLMLNKSLTPEDIVAIEKMRAQWRSLPCEWNAVFAAPRSGGATP